MCLLWPLERQTFTVLVVSKACHFLLLIIFSDNYKKKSTLSKMKDLLNISLVTSVIRWYIKLWLFSYEVKVMQSPCFILVLIILPASLSVYASLNSLLIGEKFWDWDRREKLMPILRKGSRTFVLNMFN